MINLESKSNNIAIAFNNDHSKKEITKHSEKDFFNILKDEKINHKKSKGSENCNAKDENIQLKDGKVMNEGKVMGEDEKEIEKIESKMNAILQVIFNLMVEFEEEPIKLEEMNLGTLKIEIKKLDQCMEEVLEEGDLPFTHEVMARAYETIEVLTCAIKDQLDQMESNKSKDTKNTIVKEISIEASAVKDKIVEIETNMQLSNQKSRNMPDEEDVKVLNSNSNTNNNFENMSSKEDVLSFDDIRVENPAKEGEGIKEGKNINVFSMEGMDKEISKEASRVIDKALPIIDEKQIIEQIVNKAKLVMNDEKQEIKIQLKPQILGELMLKIESEKGILLAKIMVDNYKTKELIEANLNEFKEEIKESGLEIKTFEVLVGNNEDFQKENKEKFEFNKKLKKLNIKDEGIEKIEIYDDTIVRNSQKLYNEGRLNLFA